MEEYKERKKNAFVVYNATSKTNMIVIIMKGQKQKRASDNLQIIGLPNLLIEKSKLTNTKVLKTTSKNETKQKAKTEMNHGTKKSINLTTFKMIAKQSANEKSYLEK